MVAMLRVKRTRAPLAETSIVLADVAAVEVERVVAGLALDDVVDVAGIPLEAVVAVAQERAVGALVAVDEVVAGAAVEEVVAVAAEQRVVAVAAVHRQRVSAARLPTALIVSGPSRPETTRFSASASSREVPAGATLASRPLATTGISSSPAVPL